MHTICKKIENGDNSWTTVASHSLGIILNHFKWVEILTSAMKLVLQALPHGAPAQETEPAPLSV